MESDKGKKEVLKATKKEDKDKFWGLFSLEGGKKDNMDYIVTVLKHVVHELEQEYVSNDSIYSDFLNLYHKVCSLSKQCSVCFTGNRRGEKITDTDR